MSVLELKEKNLAEAVALLIAEIHKSFPAGATHPVAPYGDEDFTLAVEIPAGPNRERVMDARIRYALRIEDQFGFSIWTRVREA